METWNGQLSRIVIHGFKSIKNCDIKLNCINVMIGSNGAGKSNFISAFDMLQNVISKNLQFWVQMNGLNSIFYNGRKTTEEICFEIYSNTNSYGFTLVPTDDNRVIFKNEFLGYDGIIANASTAHEESKWENTGNGAEVDFLKKDMLAKQNWRVYHFHDTSRSAKVKQVHMLSNNLVLMRDASNLAAFLYRLKQYYPESYEEIVETIRLIAPYFNDFILLPQEGNMEQIILKWQQKGTEDVFYASQLSDGTLRFICLAVLLLQPAELQPSTIIIDEPELGLHPYAITVFAEMVKQISGYKQIIISTQSVELLNEFDVKDIIVVDRGENGSEFKRLNEKELHIWLENDYALGDLWQKNLLGGRFSS